MGVGEVCLLLFEMGQHAAASDTRLQRADIGVPNQGCPHHSATSQLIRFEKRSQAPIFTKTWSSA